jgi:hypothetical protein
MILRFWVILEADGDAVVVLVLQEAVVRESRHPPPNKQTLFV